METSNDLHNCRKTMNFEGISFLTLLGTVCVIAQNGTPRNYASATTVQNLDGTYL